MMETPEFETIKAEEVKFGRNNFIEVARKRAKTAKGENEFISISRGFYAPDGTRRWKTSLTVPLEPEVVDFIAEKIKQV